MDELIEIKFVNEDVGYGAFAKKNIKKDIVLGEYTGLMTSEINDATYSWYLSNFYDIDNLKIYLNG